VHQFPRFDRRYDHGQGEPLRLLADRRRRALRACRTCRDRQPHWGRSRRHPAAPPLLCRRRRVGARLRLPEPRAEERLRPAHRRAQPARSFGGVAHEGDGHDRHRALRRCGHGLSFELSRFRRADALFGRHRPALLYRHRATEARHRPWPQQGEGRSALRPLHLPGAGFLMRRSSKAGRVARAILITVVGAVALPLVAAVLLTRTDAGRAQLVRLVETLASSPLMRLAIGRLDGAVPFDMTVSDVTVADREGVWLTVDRAHLAWRPLSLLSGVVEVTAVEAGRLAVTRPPVPGTEPAAESAGLPRLPVGIIVEQLAVE